MNRGLVIDGVRGGKVTVVHELRFAMEGCPPAGFVPLDGLVKANIATKRDFSKNGVSFHFEGNEVQIRVGEYGLITVQHGDLYYASGSSG